MDAYERYYRRSYNAINRLIEVYRNGYRKEENEIDSQSQLVKHY